MAALLPQAVAQELRRADLGEARLAHAAADVVLDHAIQCPAARMPEHHARPLLLLVEQVEPRAQPAVVIDIRILQAVRSQFGIQAVTGGSPVSLVRKTGGWGKRVLD